MTQTTTEWFTRWGSKHEGAVRDADLAKGTASYTYQDICHRCGGAGASDKWMFTGRVCFDCHGNGKGAIRTEKLYTAERLAKLNAAQAVRDAKKVAQRAAEQRAQEAAAQAAVVAFEAANPGFAAALEGAAERTQDAFLLDLRRKLTQTGSLSERQIAAVRASLDRLAVREQARAASQYIGTVGERVELTVTVERVIKLDNDGGSRSYHYIRFAPPTIYLCRDENGNRIVYKGSGNFPGQGETGRIKATIAGHEEYRGEQQTQVARPKWLDAPVWDAANGCIVEPEGGAQ